MEPADLGHHISRRFNDDLENLRALALQMGGFVEQQLGQAVQALAEGDSQLGEQVAHGDKKVNQMELGIDEECGRIIAMRQPTASDLRLIVAIIKASTDLERIGDEVEKVALIAVRLAREEQTPQRFRDLRHISKLVVDQVHDALHAFARLDAESALACKRRDLEVDAEYEIIQRQNMTYMMENPRNIRRAIDTMWVVRSLERVGDHAKNICEYVVYAVHGKDIRHLSLDDAEDQIREFVARRNA